MAKTISGKPITVAGIKVIPKWDWSDQYRRDVLTYDPLNIQDTNARKDSRAEAYQEWRKQQGKPHYPVLRDARGRAIVHTPPKADQCLVEET